MVINAWWLTSKVNQLCQQSLRLQRWEAGYGVRVTAYGQCPAACFRVRLGKRPQRRLLLIQPIAIILTVFVLMLKAGLALAVNQRVMRRQPFNPSPHRIVESVVGGAHIRPSGLATSRRHLIGPKNRSFCLHGHIGTVMMPAHIALQDLNPIVIRCSAQVAIFVDVAELNQVDFQRSKSFRKGDLLIVVEMLGRENQQRIAQPKIVYFREFRIV